MTYPDNTVRTYHYEDVNFVHALTGITDENRDAASRRGVTTVPAAPIRRSMPAAPRPSTLYYGARFPRRPTMAGPSWSTRSARPARTTTRSSEAWRASDTQRMESSSVTSTFDANGNLATFRDANGIQTNYTYDLARNLEISRTEAYGTPLARTIATQWHPVHRLPTRITAPSGIAGVSEVTDFAYDRAGQSASEDDHRGRRRRGNGT